MKKGIFICTVWMLIGLSIINTSCNFIPTQASAYPQLQTRKDTSQQAEFTVLEQLFKKNLQAIAKDSNDAKSKLKIVEIYINESRITGELDYYNTAAIKVLNGIIATPNVREDVKYQALTYKATVLLSLHQFAQAKVIAEQALAINPYDADIYGALVDANVELGEYKQAEIMCDKMMSIRPDIRSYSRVSYLRQINGDNDGAKKAMRLAVESGAQGQENTEWARVQLGDLYLNTGHADTAQMLFESALFARPNYPYAEMGMARMFHAINKNEEAIVHCKNAIKLMSESSFISYLGELYKASGNDAKAKEIHQDVLKLILENESKTTKESMLQHNGNRELAQAFLHANDLEQALKHANLDLAMRNNNVDANETIAWIYYLKNDFAKAKQHIDNAMVQNSQSAMLYSKAALIYEALGDLTKSSEFKNKSISINTNLTTFFSNK